MNTGDHYSIDVDVTGKWKRPGFDHGTRTKVLRDFIRGETRFLILRWGGGSVWAGRGSQITCPVYYTLVKVLSATLDDEGPHSYRVEQIAEVKSGGHHWRDTIYKLRQKAIAHAKEAASAST
jgi:hypothetical protein